MNIKSVHHLFFASILFLSFSSVAYADENQVQDIRLSEVSSSQPKSDIVEVSSVTPTLVTPKVEESPTVAPKKHTSQKIDLRAIIFDPNADFKAQAAEENREMTKMEAAEYGMHEALHGEVTETSKLSRKGLLADKTTIKLKEGPIESLSPWYAYKGSFQNIWNGANYQNTLYDTDTNFAVLEGKFRNKKTSFRIMGLFNQGKEGHDFFNDVWGDVYIMHSLTKQDQILVGYSRNSVGIEGSSSPVILPFFARSQIAKTYNNVRALGVKAQGSHKMYDYNIGVFSAGRYFLDWFPGPEFVASAAIKPLGMTDGRWGKLLIGGGIDAGNSDNRYTVGSAYIDYEYKRWNATIEYGSADGSNGSTGCTKNQSEGFNGTLAYRISPRLQALVRYDQFDPNKNKVNDIRREYTVGLNYFIKEQSVRLMVNYIMYSIENGTYGSKILLGTQIIL
jgi:hypothetical protein